ncbi:MAG: GTP-binding protein [Clostridia bacterium]|nr:GTP-binding protein [Clostridia bacterium]
MTKIDIFSGFLGAGKTTLIKKMISEAYVGEKLVLIENEFGDIGIDGGFLEDAGITINEMNSGCICCSLVGDFGKALKKVIAEYAPERILIEPSGVGKLSDIIRAVQGLGIEGIVLNSFTTVCDANKCKMYIRNFGEFFLDQVDNAGTIVLSHTGGMSDAKIDAAVKLLREHNASAVIVTTPWEQLDGKQLLEAMERRDTLEAELERLSEKQRHHHHHDHDECDDPDCHCHHHHDDDEHEHEHHHHHHDHDECDDPDCHCHHHHDDDEHEHEHHHHHHDHDECDDPDCHCHHHHDDDEHEHEHHHHHHDHDECDDPDCHCHHHHHADEVFTSWGVETPVKFTESKLREILEALENEHEYGFVLRAKGIVAASDGEWIHFDYVPGEPDIRRGRAGIIGRLCVIGSKISEDKLAELFGVTVH